MIPHQSPRQSKTEQFLHFIREPAPEKRLGNNHAYAQRHQNGSFRLFSRPHANTKPLPSTQGLIDFVDAMANEIRERHGCRADRELAKMRQMARKWKETPPTIDGLRELKAHVDTARDAPAPTERQRRARVEERVALFQKALNEQATRLPKDDGRSRDLKRAGDQLIAMLHEPGATVSLKDWSPQTLALLIDTGLLARFMQLRDCADPPLQRLILPDAPPELLDRMPTLPSIRSRRVAQPQACEAAPSGRPSSGRPHAPRLSSLTELPRLDRSRPLTSLPLSAHGKKKIQGLSPGPDNRRARPVAPQASSHPSALSGHFLDRLKNRGISELSPEEAKWVHVLGQALDDPQALLRLTDLHMPVLDPCSRIIQHIIPNFVSLRRRLSPALEQVALAPDTNKDLARRFLRSAPDTPEEAQFIATLGLRHRLCQPDAHGVLDWSTMDRATFEGLDAQGALSAFIGEQETAIERMILPAELTKQPLLLNACPQLKALRFPRPAMNALDLRHMKGLQRVEILEASNPNLIGCTQVPFGCTVSDRVRRHKPPADRRSAAPVVPLSAVPASPAKPKPAPTSAELFKRKATLLIPSNHGDRPMLLQLIDSLGDYLDGSGDTLSLQAWAPELVDTFTHLGGMSAFALSCEKAGRRPQRLCTPTQQETLPPYVAPLKPSELVFPQPDATHLKLSDLEGLQRVTLIDPADPGLTNKVQLPPGGQLVVGWSDL